MLIPDDRWDGWNRPEGWARSPGAAGHCLIINEYCWLWLYSDAAPLPHTAGIYATAVPSGKADERQEYRWFMTAAPTEFWRFQRCAVGVLYYEYLGSVCDGTSGTWPIPRRGRICRPGDLAAPAGIREVHERGVQAAGGLPEILGRLVSPGKRSLRSLWSVVPATGRRRTSILHWHDQ